MTQIIESKWQKGNERLLGGASKPVILSPRLCSKETISATFSAWLRSTVSILPTSSAASGPQCPTGEKEGKTSLDTEQLRTTQSEVQMLLYQIPNRFPRAAVTEDSKGSWNCLLVSSFLQWISKGLTQVKTRSKCKYWCFQVILTWRKSEETKL